MILNFSALDALHWISEQGDGDHALPEEICPKRHQAGVFHELAENGLIINDQRLAGGYTFQISPRAYAAVDRLTAQYRQGAIQMEILRRIAAAPDQGATDDYFSSLEVRGEPVSKSEFERAVAYLQTSELIKGTSTWGGPLLRPELTPLGHEAYESGFTPQNWVSQRSGDSYTTTHGDTHTMTITGGNVGAAQIGKVNTANVVQVNGLDIAAFEQAMAGIRDALTDVDLPEQTRQAASVQLDLIDETAKNGGARQRVQSFFHMFVAALPAALASEVSDFVANALAAIPA